MACRKCSFRKRVEKYARYSPKQAIYLDYCATTPVDLSTIGVYEKTCRNMWGNSSSFHGVGQTAFELLEKCREDIARYLNIFSENIFFTYSSVNAFSVSLKLFIQLKKISQVITTVIDHSSVFQSLESLDHKGMTIAKLPVDSDGKIDLNGLETLFKKEKSIFIFSPVNHETGSRQDFVSIFNLAEKYGSIVIFDSVQAMSRLNCKEWITYCHAFIISSHKIYGPKGVSMLYFSPLSDIAVDEETCLSEGGLFPGTVNLPAICSFTEAVRLYSENIEQDLNHYRLLTDETYSILNKSSVEFQKESPEDSVPGIINISLQRDNLSMEDLFLYLYREKICISRFSACTGKLDGPSEILQSMNRSGNSVLQSLRISLGRESSRNHVYALTKALKAYLNTRK
jgi:cysteine desulfurase